MLQSLKRDGLRGLGDLGAWAAAAIVEPAMDRLARPGAAGPEAPISRIPRSSHDPAEPSTHERHPGLNSGPISRLELDSFVQVKTKARSGLASHSKQSRRRPDCLERRDFGTTPGQWCRVLTNRIDGVPVSTAGTQDYQALLSLAFERCRGPWTPCPSVVGQDLQQKRTDHANRVSGDLGMIRRRASTRRRA